MFDLTIADGFPCSGEGSEATLQGGRRGLRRGLRRWLEEGEGGFEGASKGLRRGFEGVREGEEGRDEGLKGRRGLHQSNLRRDEGCAKGASRDLRGG